MIPGRFRSCDRIRGMAAWGVDPSGHSRVLRGPGGLCQNFVEIIRIGTAGARHNVTKICSKPILQTDRHKA
jgi:hypothetical protein